MELCSKNVAALASWEALLSSEEKRAAGRFLRVVDRERYIAAHGRLRQLLGRYLACDPAELVFALGKYGKPELVLRKAQREVSFNLAHSGEVILFGITSGSKVGVDVELVRSDLDVMSLAQSQFSREEIDALEATQPTERVEAFYRCWTLKEAYVKARGEGLALPLKQFSVAFGSEQPPVVSWAADDALALGRWSAFSFEPVSGYAGAVMVEGRPVRLVSPFFVEG